MSRTSQSSTQGDVYESSVPVKSPWTAGPADTLTNRSGDSFCTSGFSRTQESLRPGWMVDFKSLNLFTNIFVAGKVCYHYFSRSSPTCTCQTKSFKFLPVVTHHFCSVFVVSDENTVEKYEFFLSNDTTLLSKRNLMKCGSYHLSGGNATFIVRCPGIASQVVIFGSRTNNKMAVLSLCHVLVFGKSVFTFF